ncbi:MAG TPA: Dabb family protein, partial [Acidimicrobiales bacterium]|nr:Dabb family protein [Acidimicrobiales bacterium]
MFRQVVSVRWAEGVSSEARQAYRDALDGLRAIPELLALTYGDDAGHFEGNFDFVAVMDFADFDAARRYVAHPLHQAYIRDHA